MDEKIFESGYQNNQVNVKEGLATSTGIVIKSIIGVFIAFYIALPRLASGKYFGEFFFRGGFIGDLFGMIIFTIIIGFIWAALTKALKADKGAILNAITYGLASIFSGLFLANSLIVAVSWISYYGELNIGMVAYALQLTAIVTFIAVLGGILILPRIKMTERTIRFGKNASLIVMGLALSSFVMVIVGLLFAALGMPFLLDMWGRIFYGVGPISIFISVIGVFFAEVLFLGTLSFVKYGIGRIPKHEEYYLSIVLVNGILRLYIEIFRLILKVLAAKNRNR